MDIGLAADLGTLQRFPRVVGNESWTRELAFSARYFSAGEALEKGFVSYVLETQDAAVNKGMEIAKTIASKSPIAVYGTKTLLDYSRDHSIREGLEYTQLWNSIYLQTSVSCVRNELTKGYQGSNRFLLRKAQAKIFEIVKSQFTYQYSRGTDTSRVRNTLIVETII